VPVPSDPLEAATLRSQSEDSAAIASAPCLTILAHPEVERIGQRILLDRDPLALSRATEFAGAPLADPFLSRRMVDVIARWPVAVDLVPAERGRVRVVGAPLERKQTFAFAEVRAGIVIELGSRVALLLHTTMTEARAPTFDLVGNSDAIENVRRAIARVADLEVSVLIRGETGVGKEHVAQAIHAASGRRSGPCVAINMATIAPATAASELFGHARGAFTGAATRHAGVFERAEHGTLFLDEIGETPAAIQPMLLRALESREVLPVGDDATRPIDVRVIAATDADLESASAHGQFRAALLHRLAGYEIAVPPLRARKDDIARLLVHFLRRELTATGELHRLALPEPRATPWLPSALVVRLCAQPWPGNVRQLANVARQLVISSRGADAIVVDASVERLLRPDEPDHAESGPPGAALPAIDDVTLTAAMRAHNWAPGPTAKALGIPTSTLHDLIAGCPTLRKAKDIPAEELRACHAACDGDLDAMATRLEVSKRGIRLRLTQLGIA